jgi:hypothetical protein
MTDVVETVTFDKPESLDSGRWLWRVKHTFTAWKPVKILVAVPERLASMKFHGCGASVPNTQPYGEVLVVPNDGSAGFDLGYWASSDALGTWCPYDFGVLDRERPLVITLDVIDLLGRRLPTIEMSIIALELPRYEWA